MGDLAKRLSGPTHLTTSAATQYTVPASTKAIIRNIHAANTSASAATFTMSIGTDAAGKRLWSGHSIPANDVLDWSGFMVLDAAEIIQAFSGSTNVICLTISGVEVT